LDRVRETTTLAGSWRGPKGLIVMMWHNGWGAGNWLLMSFMMLLFWTLLVGFIIWAIRGHHAAPRQDADQARRILEERFARGEIDAEDYRTRRDHLTDAVT
jgi:putative membrane protein